MLLFSYFIVYSLVDALIHAGLDFTLGLATAIWMNCTLDIIL